MNSRKYIVIPECKPLFAMQRCFGPTHGPLKPTPTPIGVIGDLLQQKPKMNEVTVYEVVPTDVPGKFSDPVQLTLENYKLPYELIVAGMTGVEELPTGAKMATDAEPISMGVETEESVAVAAVESAEESVTANTPVAEDAQESTVVAESAEEVGAADIAVDVTDDSVDVEVSTEPRPMTKAERRAAAKLTN